MENDKKRLSHYIPAELVDRFNERADAHEPRLQRQVYFERILVLGLVADAALEDLLKAGNQALFVLSKRAERDTVIWDVLAEEAAVDLIESLAMAETEVFKYDRRNT